MAHRIYTRTGDDGTTGLVDGSRTAKHSARVAAIGEVDECNSFVGWALVAAGDEMARELLRIQNDLFDLGADLATPGEGFLSSQMVLRLSPEQVVWLEERIDRLSAALPPLKNFILPGGNELASRLHLARATARRAERAMSVLADQEPVNPAALAFINRLSDYLFVAARAAAAPTGGDVLWQPGANR